MLTPTPIQQQPGTPFVPSPPPPPTFQGGAMPGFAAVDQATIRSLIEQVAALRAQQRVLTAQTHSRDPGVASSAQAALPGVEMQLAKANLDLEIASARLRAQRNQFQYEQGRPNGSDRARPNADQITAMSLAFIFAVLMPISIAISRRIFRRASKRSDQTSVDVISPRLDRLEQAVDAVAIEVERISEGQRFVTKVLIERPAQARAAASARPGTVSGSHDTPAGSEPKPFLALGAGPIEPIRAAERQAVRQSVTPH